jgi:DNA-binding CsgD family transcriptional regulator
MASADLPYSDLTKLLDLAKDLALIECIDAFPGCVEARMRELLPADRCSFVLAAPLQAEHPQEPLGLRMAAEQLAPITGGRPAGAAVLRSDAGSGRGASRIKAREGASGVQQARLLCQIPTVASVAINLEFVRRHRAFDLTERRFIDHARLHIGSAYRRLELELKSRALAELLLQSERYLGVGLIAVSGSGVVMAVTEPALKLCQRSLGGVPKVDALLPPSLLELFVRLRTSLRPTQGLQENIGHSAPERLRIKVSALFPDSDAVHLIALSDPGEPLPVSAMVQLGLTPRQAEVLLQLAQGNSNKSIARHLGITPATVKTHLEEIYRRLGAENRTAAVCAIRNALGVSTRLGG